MKLYDDLFENFFPSHKEIILQKLPYVKEILNLTEDEAALCIFVPEHKRFFPVQEQSV